MYLTSCAPIPRDASRRTIAQVVKIRSLHQIRERASQTFASRTPSPYRSYCSSRTSAMTCAGWAPEKATGRPPFADETTKCGTPLTPCLDQLRALLSTCSRNSSDASIADAALPSSPADVAHSTSAPCRDKSFASSK
uniref:Uncharacterized protein n=1 Tax=Chrysotila carterae TaxID=13221 RepID=A0A7S4B5L0_CHRCT